MPKTERRLRRYEPEQPLESRDIGLPIYVLALDVLVDGARRDERD